ncbi:MAG: class I SAM-dependent methyltransferase [Caulobacteraceae bacterium]
MSASLGLTDAVRAYVQERGVREPTAMARCRHDTAADARRGLQISPEQGAFMGVIAKAIRARQALEVGVFTGYSALAVALAMQAMHGNDARLVACDISADYLDRAAGYWREAGVAEIIAPRRGPAADSLAALIEEEGEAGFDLMFIDADKTGYDDYYELGLRLLRPGGLMLIDNMLWSGAVADLAITTDDTVALRTLAAKIHADDRVEMTLATVGDGLSIVIKR